MQSSYGGIFELGTREYTLDDFYALQLDKLDRFVCLNPSGIVIPTEAEESSDDSEGEGSDEDEDEDEDDSEIESEEDEKQKKSKGKDKEREKERKGKKQGLKEIEEEPEGRVEGEERTGTGQEVGEVRPKRYPLPMAIVYSSHGRMSYTPE